MAFKDYSTDPDANTTIGESIYIGPNMARNLVRPALQQIAADGRELYDEMLDLDASFGGGLLSWLLGTVQRTLAAILTPIIGRTPEDYGAVGGTTWTGTPDSTAAIQLMFDSARYIRWPDKAYKVSGPVYVRQRSYTRGNRHTFDARIGGQENMPGSRLFLSGPTASLIFEPQAHERDTALVIADTLLYFIQEGAANSVFKGVAVIGDRVIANGGAPSLTAAPLVEIRTKMRFEDNLVYQGRGINLSINGSAAYATIDASYGNPSQAYIANNELAEAGLDNLNIGGVDANVIKLLSNSYINGGRWGRYDTSLLGNDEDDAHYANNNRNFANATSGGAFRASSDQYVGSVKCTSTVGDHTFTACYVEFFSGSGFDLPQTCTVKGGTMCRSKNYNPSAPPQEFGIYAYGNKGRYFYTDGNDTTTTPQLRVGHGPTLLGTELVAHAFGVDDDRAGAVGGDLDHSLYEDFAWRYHLTFRDFDWGPTHYRAQFGGTGKLMRAPKGGTPAARFFAPSFDNGIHVGNHYAQFIGRQAAGAVPDGVYAVGDVLLNDAPVAAGKLFKVCITAGVKSSTAWAAGQALNVAYSAPFDAVYRTNAGNVYKLTTAPAIGNTANAPVHGAGAVTGADGYGWTFMNATTVPAFKDAGAIDA